MDLFVENPIEQCSETGLFAVQTGADVRDHLFAPGLLQSLDLALQVAFFDREKTLGHSRCVCGTGSYLRLAEHQAQNVEDRRGCEWQL